MTFSILKNCWIHLFSVFLVTFIVYFWSAPATVTLEDDGYFILAAYFNGIAHPPGYPLYTLLAHVSTYIPYGTEAFRVHILSMFLGGVSCACVWLITLLVIQEKSLAYLAAFGFGFSRTFWSQSIIAEVYTLHVMIFSLLVLLTLLLHRVDKDHKKRNCLILIFLLSGLGLSNHWPLLLLALPCLIVLLWPQRKFVIRNFFRLTPFIVIGLLPYFWLLYRAGMDPEISFFGPVNTISDLWLYIIREPYSAIDSSPTAGIDDKLRFVVFFFRETNIQFGITGIFLVIAGFLFQWRYLPLYICIAFLLGFLLPSMGLIYLLDFDYDFLHQVTFRVYPLTAYLIAAIWLAVGVKALADFLDKKLHRNNKNNIYKPALVMLVIFTTVFSNVAANYRANDKWAEQYAITFLKTVPENAAVFVTGDTTVGPLGYMHYVRDYREDIELYSLTGTLFKNRLFHPLKAGEKEISAKINNFIDSAPRPVLYNEYLDHDYGWEFYGLYYRFLQAHDRNFHRVVVLPEILDYFESIHRQGLPVDDWEKIHYRTILAKGCNLLSLLSIDPGQMSESRQVNELKNKLCSNLMGQYIQIGILLNDEKPQLQNLEFHVKKAEKYLDQVIVKEQYSKIDYFRGKILVIKKRYSQAIKHFNKSIDVWPHPENPSFTEIERLVDLNMNTSF